MPIQLYVLFYFIGFIPTWALTDAIYRSNSRLSNTEISFIAILWPLFCIKGILYVIYHLIFGIKGFCSTLKRLFMDWDYS